jgi:hypothetical protein
MRCASSSPDRCSDLMGSMRECVVVQVHRQPAGFLSACSLGFYPIRDAFGDRHYRGIEVGADDVGHDRGVGYTESCDAVHAKVGVDDAE